MKNNKEPFTVVVPTDNDVFGHDALSVPLNDLECIKNVLSKSFVISKHQMEKIDGSEKVYTNVIDLFSWFKVIIYHLIDNCNKGNGIHMTEYKESTEYDDMNITNIDGILAISLHNIQKDVKRPYRDKVVVMKFDETKTSKRFIDRAVVSFYHSMDSVIITLNDCIDTGTRASDVNHNIMTLKQIFEQEEHQTCFIIKHIFNLIENYIKNNYAKIIRNKIRKNMTNLCVKTISKNIEESLEEYDNTEFFNIGDINGFYSDISKVLEKRFGKKYLPKKFISYDTLLSLTDMEPFELNGILQVFGIELFKDDDLLVINTEDANKLFNLQ